MLPPWRQPKFLARSTGNAVAGSHSACLPANCVLHDGSAQAQRKIKDEELLGEMLFGSIPMTFDEATTKIHELRGGSSQLMVSHVFTSFGGTSRDSPSDALPTSRVRFAPGSSYSALRSGAAAVAGRASDAAQARHP